MPRVLPTRPCRPVARRADRLRPNDRGSSSVELVLLAPALMFAIFLLIQAALYMHARHVALAGAQQGARLARTSSADSAALEQVRAATGSYLQQLGGGVLSHSQVAVSTSNGVARVDVTGQAGSIVPGISLTVRAHSAGPTETFRRP
jgi:Flp pilus assembly protein TadG